MNTVIKDLSHAFEEFKQTNDERLRGLELKGSTDPLVEEKIARLQHNIDYLEQKQRDFSRPQIDGGNDVTLTTGETKAFSSYLRSGDEAQLSLETKSLSRGVDADGGYFVPDHLGQMISQKLGENSIRKLASTMTVSSDHVDLLLDRGAIPSGWVAETDARPETDTPNVQKKRLSVNEIYAKPRSTQKLLDDANIDVDKWLSDKISTQFGLMENQAFLHGDGANKPKGILSIPTSNDLDPAFGRFRSVSSGVDGAFPDDDASDLVMKMVYRIKSCYLNNGSWLMSRSALQHIRLMKDQQGHYLWQPANGENGTPTLLGFPVFVDDEMPGVVAGTASSPVLFGDFKSAYQIVDRAGVQILRDPFSAKPFVEFYATKRVGGDVIDTDALSVMRLAA